MNLTKLQDLKCLSSLKVNHCIQIAHLSMYSEQLPSSGVQVILEMFLNSDYYN